MTTTKKNRKGLIIVLAGLLLFGSCDSRGIFNQYTSLPDNVWLQNNPIHFGFQISDTISKNNLYLNIRNNRQYQYSNLFVITHLIFPNGSKIVDTLQYEMADKNGQFLGTGISEIRHSTFFFKENSLFPLSGKYKLSIWQAMRKNGSINGIKELQGITDVGFRIEKVN